MIALFFGETAIGALYGNGAAQTISRVPSPKDPSYLRHGYFKTDWPITVSNNLITKLRTLFIIVFPQLTISNVILHIFEDYDPIIKIHASHMKGVMSESAAWVEKQMGEKNEIILKMLTPGDPKYTEYLKAFWIRLASRNPDKISDPFFMRTSIDFEHDGPLVKKITVTDDQQIFVPVCSCCADDEHYSGNPIDEVKKGIPDGTRPHLELTVDGFPLFASDGEWDKYYISPEEWQDYQIDENSPFLGTKLHLIHTGRSKRWSAAGYCVLLKLQPRDKRYWIHISSKTEDGYITSAYYGVRSIAKP